MESLKRASVYIFTLLMFTFSSCNDEPLEGQFNTGGGNGGGGASSCVEATTNVGDATTAFNAVTPSDANYTSVCNDYANALEDFIDLCGDTGGIVQSILDGLDCTSSTPDDCPTAQSATDAAESAYNADTTNATLCNAYISALQNEIVECGDTTGELQDIIDGLDCIVSPDYEIGDIGPGGGFVFYLDGTGGGLEVAPLETEFQTQWGCYNMPIAGTSASLGSGQSNTNVILEYHNGIDFYANPAQCQENVPPVGVITSTGDVAAKNCDDLVFGGMTDWYLPSIDEVSLIYTNLISAALGDITGGDLCSSTDDDDNYLNMFIIFTSDGSVSSQGKYNLWRHRAIRAF